MYNSESKKELQNFLMEKPKECKVVVLPDFFLDRLSKLELESLRVFRVNFERD